MMLHPSMRSVGCRHLGQFLIGPLPFCCLSRFICSNSCMVPLFRRPRRSKARSCSQYSMARCQSSSSSPWRRCARRSCSKASRRISACAVGMAVRVSKKERIKRLVANWLRPTPSKRARADSATKVWDVAETQSKSVPLAMAFVNASTRGCAIRSAATRLCTSDGPNSP